jgi:protein TonB
MVRVKDIDRDRAGSAAAVALVHGLLAYLLLTGLGFDPVAQVSEQLKMFDVAEEPPPPPAEPAAPEKVVKSAEAKPKDPEGAASPANLKDTPTQIVVPPPKIVLKLPPPIPAAPVAGRGNAPAAGAAEIPGPGTGRGGFGSGLGSGAYGDGTGGGGGGLGRATKVRWLSGTIDPDDYPENAFRRRIMGIVHLRFTVAPSGRVSDCTVTRSSGSDELDRTTCRLIVRRFRYRPATNGEGRPIPATIRGQHEWAMSDEPPPIDVEPEEEY